jgi:hypothetical protein
MFFITTDKAKLVSYIISANEEDSPWSIEYAAPGFFFHTEDALLMSSVEHYLKEAE